MMQQARSGQLDVHAEATLDRRSAASDDKTRCSIGSGAMSRRRTGRTARRLAVLIIGTGAAFAFSAPAFAYTPRSPKLAATQATFAIPVLSTSTWTLRLWSHGSLEGSDSGTAGMLTVAVPATSDCVFQADVSVTPVGGASSFYSGARATVPGCGALPTIAGNIYLCPAAGATTVEVPGGSLTAIGPQTLAQQPNPMEATPVLSGDYTMTAGSPSGYMFVACGGSAVVASSGTSATELVPVFLGDTGSAAEMAHTVSGGGGVGIFYVTTVTPPAGAGGGATAPAGSALSGAQTTPGPAVAASSVTPADGTAHVPTTAVGSSALAFTGLNTKPFLLVGLLLLSLGALCTAAGRARRRTAVAHRSPSRGG
jgi:hypothetical protein